MEFTNYLFTWLSRDAPKYLRQSRGYCVSYAAYDEKQRAFGADFSGILARSYAFPGKYVLLAFRNRGTLFLLRRVGVITCVRLRSKIMAHARAMPDRSACFEISSRLPRSGIMTEYS